MKTIFNIVLFLFFFSELINSQVTLEWARRYNGPINDYDAANAITVDDSGIVYVTGGSRSNTGFDYSTIKYSSTGNVEWLRRFNGIENGDDVARDIALDNSGNVYVTGVSTIKYNSNGDSIWVRRFIGIGSGGVKLALNSNNDIYVGGININDYALIKYDINGNIIWTRTYNGPANDQDHLTDIALDLQGNIIVTGESRGIGTDFDYATIKYDSAGNQLWVRRYNGLASNVPTDIARALTVDDSGNVYVTGWSQGTDEDFDCVTIKYKPNGDTAWIKSFSGPGYTGDDIILDKMRNIYIAGQVQGNYMLLKYNNNGNFVWQRTKPKTAFSPSPSLTLDTLGYIYLACAKPVTSTREDLLIVKYDSNGNQKWEGTYNSGFPNDINFPYKTTVDKNFNVYAAGYSVGNGTLQDYITVKFSQTIGIIQISNEIPQTFELFQNYPNPFNLVTKIKFDLSSNVKIETSNVKLVIYDVLGREVATIVDEELKPGTYEADWDGSKCTSGVYFYTLFANIFKETKKMILLK